MAYKTSTIWSPLWRTLPQVPDNNSILSSPLPQEFREAWQDLMVSPGYRLVMLPALLEYQHSLVLRLLTERDPILLRQQQGQLQATAWVLALPQLFHQLAHTD